MSLIRLVKMLGTLMMLACVQGPFRSKNQSALSVQHLSTSPSGRSIISSSRWHLDDYPSRWLVEDGQIWDSCLSLMPVSIPTQFLVIAVKSHRFTSLTNPIQLEIHYSQTIAILFLCLVVRPTWTSMNHLCLPLRRPTLSAVFIQM